MTLLTEEDNQLIAFQEQRFEALRASLIKNKSRREEAVELGQLSQTIDSLRVSLHESREEEAANVATQLHIFTSLAEHKLQRKIPNLNLPYFGFVRLADHTGKTRDIFIGETAYIDADTKIYVVNWSESPFAEVFFTCREGEEYDIDLPNGTIATGKVLQRIILSFHNGKLMRLDRGPVSLLRDGDGWQRQDGAVAKLRGGEGATIVESHLGTGATNLQNPIVKALLDPQQYALIQSPGEDPLVVIGSAGCGKTTVALHRLAALHGKDPVKLCEKSLLVIVPERGLESLTRRLLDDLSLAQVRVRRLDDWLVREGKRMLKNLPRRICTETPAAVRRFKGHKGFQLAVQRYQDNLECDLIARMAKKRHFLPAEVAEAFAKANKVPLVRRLQKLEKKVREFYAAELPLEKETSLRQFIAAELARLFNWQLDRETLFGDDNLLQYAVARSDGGLTAAMVREVKSHNRMQLADGAERRYEGWAADSLTAVDHKGLDEDTPDDVAATIDVEDFAVLFYLLQLRTGGLVTPDGHLRQYQHIVLDEAQEYSPLELAVIGKALKVDGGITVAGDAAQQTDPTSHFKGWDKVLSDLGVKQVKLHKLNISYRSTRQIMNFADKILGPLAPVDKPVCHREGPGVKITQTTSAAESFVLMADALHDLEKAEPAASVAVICQNSDTAYQAFKRLEDLGRKRFVTDGIFVFKPGVDFTDAVQVKGLEFDYVIIPDANLENYPEDPLARRKLHVAATRAIHQLWVLTSGRPSPLLT